MTVPYLRRCSVIACALLCRAIGIFAKPGFNEPDEQNELYQASRTLRTQQKEEKRGRENRWNGWAARRYSHEWPFSVLFHDPAGPHSLQAETVSNCAGALALKVIYLGGPGALEEINKSTIHIYSQRMTEFKCRE